MSSNVGTPSWASTQRLGGQYKLPSSGDSLDSVSVRGVALESSNPTGNLSRDHEQYQQQSQQPFQWPQKMGNGPSVQTMQSNRTSSYQPLLAQQSPQQQLQQASPTDEFGAGGKADRHRRTQSLRPFSAFQPLERQDPYGSPREGSNRPPSPAESTARSISKSAAPLTFKSPELRSALFLQDAQQRKIYMEGYLSRRDALGADGKPLHPHDPKKAWHLCFVQLSGTVLSVWSVAQMDQAAREGREVPPTYINVTDSFVDLIGNFIEDPNEVPGSRGRYENVFALNSAGNNRILFCVEGAVGRRLVQAWINAIRLASWEKVRLEEIYTGALIRARLGSVGINNGDSSPMQGPPPAVANMNVASPLAKQGRMEGWVKARFMGSTEWKKCWLVLSRDKAEAQGAASGGVGRRLWSKLAGAGDRSSILSITSDNNPAALTAPGRSTSTSEPYELEAPSGSSGAPGIAQFFVTKKDKKPFATMLYAAHVFAVYPSRPELVEGSSLFKLEGSFPQTQVFSATNRLRQSGWVMIMPELEAASKGANADMMKWVIAFMDAFGLYGRPTGFVWDARDPVSAFFAYPIGQYKERLFLDRELAEFLDVREERHLATRASLHGIMAARMRGERTPLLPPLPQPNTAHTKQLNGARGLAGAGSKQQDPEDQSRETKPASPRSRAPSLPEMQTGLSPLKGGDCSSDPGRELEPFAKHFRESCQVAASCSQHMQDKSQASQPTSSYLNMHSQDRVSERLASDTGHAQQSNGDGLRTPRTTQVGSQSVSRQGSIRGDNRAEAVSQRQEQTSVFTDGRPRSPPQQPDLSVSNISPETITSSRSFPSSHRGSTGLSRDEVDSIRSGSQQQSSLNGTAPETRSIATTNTAAPSLPAQKDQQALHAVPAPSGRGAEAEQTATATGGQRDRSATDETFRYRQSDADFSSSYDEGALFYLRSMSDQLPAVPALSSERPKDSPIADTSSSYTQPSYAPSQLTEAAPSRNVSAKTPQAQVGSLFQDDDHLDEDAMAAYSYLDQPPSPDRLVRQRSLPRKAAVQQAASRAHGDPLASVQASEALIPTGSASQAPQMSYPSTFGQNKRAQERKEAAQAQAAAHAQALSKPGKVAGQRKGMKPKGRHAWGDESSEEEGEEDEDDEDDGDDGDEKFPHSKTDAAKAGKGAQGVTSTDMNSVMLPAGATQLRVASPAAAAARTAAAAGLPPPGRTMSQYSSGSGSGVGYGDSGRNSPRQVETSGASSGTSHPAQARAGGIHPALVSQRQSVFNSHLGAPHADEDARSISPGGSGSQAAGGGNRQTFVQLDPQEQPGSMTAVFQPHGLLEAGAQDKQERSAKQQELEARMAGVGMVNLPSKPPPPQAGLLGAISAHERDRKGAGGYGATLTERERQRVEAERRQREEDAAMVRNSMSVGPAQGTWGAGSSIMPGYNPFMWQQMMMMNPMIGMGMRMPPSGFGGPGSQMSGHLGGGGSNVDSPLPVVPQMDPYIQQQMQQQMAAAMAAQQAYMQAMSQHGGGSMVHGEQGQQQPGQMPGSPNMMGINPMTGVPSFPNAMPMYGMPLPSMMPGYGTSPLPGSGSEFGTQARPASPPRQSRQSRRMSSGGQQS